ncbi:hypothetical protein TNCV_4601981 [Trichonephila clavipes]|nr:hypothetical protein TNCV_4601981 [Trichonephila clavipes]
MYRKGMGESFTYSHSKKPQGDNSGLMDGLWTGWDNWFVAGLGHPWLWVRSWHKVADFHDAENQQRPCRIIMWHVKTILSAGLAWIISTN